MKILLGMLGLLISLELNSAHAMPPEGSGGDNQEFSILHKITDSTAKKEKLCNKYCHTAFKTGSWNPGKQLAAKLNFSSTQDETKCKMLCKGRGYIDIMNRLRGAANNRKIKNKMNSGEKHELNLACTKHSRKYLQEIFGWSCGRHCAKLKSKGKYSSSGGSIGSRKQCKKACKKKKSAFQKAALSFCSGSVSHNPLIMLMHTREEDYMKPIGNIKNEVQKFWDSFTTTVDGRTVKAFPDKVIWNDGDISAVIFQDEDDEAESKEKSKVGQEDEEEESLEDEQSYDFDLQDEDVSGIEEKRPRLNQSSRLGSSGRGGNRGGRQGLQEDELGDEDLAEG